MTSRGVSVVICCYNSELRIQKTLSYLEQQVNMREINWEIIVVDNSSDDNTTFTASKTLMNFKLPNFSYSVVAEEKPGLRNARLKGISVAKYKFLLFCDDDNWLDKNYISQGFKILCDRPDIGVLGGVANPVFEITQPAWFNKYQLFFAVGKQSDTTGDISLSKGWVYGAGFFLNKEAINDISNHRFISIGRKGKALSSGEDVEFCFIIIHNGYKVWYSEELQFDHFMESSRLCLDYLKRLMVAGAKNAYYLDGLSFKARKTPGNKWYKRRWIGRFIIDVLRIRDWRGDGHISTLFKLKLHILRMLALLRLNFRYDRSFKS